MHTPSSFLVFGQKPRKLGSELLEESRPRLPDRATDTFFDVCICAFNAQVPGFFAQNLGFQPYAPTYPQWLAYAFLLSITYSAAECAAPSDQPGLPRPDLRPSTRSIICLSTSPSRMATDGVRVQAAECDARKYRQHPNELAAPSLKPRFSSIAR